MITADIEDHGFGCWLVLRCGDCEWLRVIGPFTQPGKLADDVGEHKEKHDQQRQEALSELVAEMEAQSGPVPDSVLTDVKAQWDGQDS